MKKPLLLSLLLPALAYGSAFFGGAPNANPNFSGSILFGTYHLEPNEYDNGTCLTTNTVNWSNASSQKVAITGNCTFTFSNGVTGAAYLLKITQDVTGGRTYTWPAAVKWPASTAPSASAGSKIDILSFYYDGTYYLGSSQLNY